MQFIFNSAKCKTIHRYRNTEMKNWRNWRFLYW